MDMKIVAKECFYLHGLLALLERMHLDYTEWGIWVAGQRFIPFFIFTDNNAQALYKSAFQHNVLSPSIMFCSDRARTFLQDIWFREEIYFISLSDDCYTISGKINSAIERVLNPKRQRIVPSCPYIRLDCDEVNVIRFLLKGYKPSMISSSLNMTIRQISLHKRSAMRKLQVKSFVELYFKVKLLDHMI
ncbi:Bacterial regulatory proteins, luxR family [Cedecea lapagei]|uniref:Bacterial regulatory proteins, luxR family n=2 Tax=Cedecea lapagei TaxID=158823 RepID=A0A447V697_9ENTR|nr:Bacterial regulatory proteins, luxR family [Cedecea lapagei]